MRLGHLLLAPVVAGVLLATVQACSSFEAAAPDSGGGDVGGDGGGGDGGGGDGAAMPFCASRSGAALCDDFDEPAKVVWPDRNVTAVGARLDVISGGEAASFPSWVRAIVDARTGGCGSAILSRTNLDLPAANGIHAEYKIRPFSGTMTSVGVTLGLAIELADVKKTAICEYSFQLSKSSPSFQEQLRVNDVTPGSAVITQLGYAPLPGAFHLVTLDIDGPPLSRKAHITVDGKDAALVALRMECQGADRITKVSLGLYCTGEGFTEPVVVGFDDVLVTGK